MNLNILRLHSHGKQQIIISAFLFLFFLSFFFKVDLIYWRFSVKFSGDDMWAGFLWIESKRHYSTQVQHSTVRSDATLLQHNTASRRTYWQCAFYLDIRFENWMEWASMINVMCRKKCSHDDEWLTSTSNSTVKFCTVPEFSHMSVLCDKIIKKIASISVNLHSKNCNISIDPLINP